MLIDSPPLLVASDSLVLSGKVDGVIVVTRLGVSRRGMLRDLRRVLQTSLATKFGFVITASHLEDASYGGYYQRAGGHEGSETRGRSLRSRGGG